MAEDGEVVRQPGGRFLLNLREQEAEDEDAARPAPRAVA